MSASEIKKDWVLTVEKEKWNKQIKSYQDTNVEYMHQTEKFREIHLKNCEKTVENLNIKIHNMQEGLRYHKRALETVRELQTKLTALIKNSNNKWSEILDLFNLLNGIKDGNKILSQNPEFRRLQFDQYHSLVQKKGELELYARLNLEKLRIIRIQNTKNVYDCFCN